MSRVFLMLCCVACFSASALGQNPKVFYAESFRQGPTQVNEESFEAKLDPQNPNYKERIKDLHGNDHYVLTIVPLMPEGDNQVTSWEVKMTDLRHPIYDNILKTTPDGSSEAKDTLGWLNPSRFSAVPITARRVLKVDNFYLVLEVKASHFTPSDSPYLDSMTVDLKLTNTDPRNSKQ